MLRYRLLPTSAVLALVLGACAGGGDPSSADPAPSDAASEAAAPSEAAEPSEAGAPSDDAEPSEAAGEEVRVMLESFVFDPTELTISVGTEVTFLNADPAAHTVTHGTDGEAADDPIIDDELAGNQATSFTFDEPGTYELTCRLHPSMNMTITVEG
jgi:plastocyanin